MAIQFSANTRNNMLDSIETSGGTTPILSLWTGALPANCATANAGTKVSTVNLPSDWMAAASGGSKAKNGTWQDTAADASGAVVHFRIHNSAGTECIMQGTCSNTSGGGDLELDNTTVNANQTITITGFTINAPNG